MQKLLTIAIPSYNSQEYLHKAVESLLPGGEKVEILIVDDGSKDETGRIADAYAEANPGIVRAIHKENGGHGDAVMTGLQEASGLYFKVVDSDDWVDEEAYPRVLAQLEKLSATEEQVDLLIADYVYDKVGANHKHVVRYGNALPVDRRFRWADAGRFRTGQYILMHSAIYRTAMLRESGMTLPKHTFYVDNLYVYVPMQKVETLYYMDEVLYHYYIGREDQSVHEEVMIRRIDQQLLVNRMMLDAVDVMAVQEPKKRAYMLSYLEIITTVSSILLYRSGTAENLAKKKALWQDMEREHPEVYRKLRWRPLGICLHLPGKVGRWIACRGYELAQSIYGFN